MIKKNLLPTEDRQLFDRSPTYNNADELLEDVGVRRVLLRLYEANNSAIAFGRDPWDFAVELPQLSEFGVGTHTLRTMICRQWITHMREVPSADRHRAFEAESDLVLSSHSCFVLTRKGFENARNLTVLRNTSMNEPEMNAPSPVNTNPFIESQPTQQSQTDPNNPNVDSRPMPCWDRERRELRIGDVVVKRFKWPAENQEQVLDAFQEEGWPAHIDDPLVPHPKICPKRRLHDTLKCLNRKQVNEIIKFRGDGTGQGVLLEINWQEPG